MAKRKSNRYAKKASKQTMLAHLHSHLDTKGDMKNSGLETLKDLVIGVIGGGVFAAVVGKPSLLIGLAVSGVGHYMDNRLVSTLGLGMMASTPLTSKGVNGLDGLDGIKERLQAYKDSLAERTYLDKIMKKKDGVVSGIGELQYFNMADYNGPVNGADDNYLSALGDNDYLSGDDPNLAALDNIERQIEDAGMARLQGAPIGALELEGLGDIADNNY